MQYLIETAWGVFEAEVIPDIPGWLRRTLLVRQLSGHPLSDEEWERAGEAIADTMRNAGNVITAAKCWRMSDDPAI